LSLHFLIAEQCLLVIAVSVLLDGVSYRSS
jgi:hypothetical protein